MWPLVLDEDPLREDKRTEHESVAVTRGETYAASVWIHTRDFDPLLRKYVGSTTRIHPADWEQPWSAPL